jgi:hypothetical protein
VVWSCKKNGQNKDTEPGIRINIYRIQTNKTTQNKNVLPSTGRHQEEMKSWQKKTGKETLWEDTRDWRPFVLNPYKTKTMLKEDKDD